MKIYFAGSIRGGREDGDRYHSLIEHLKQYGEVLSEHIGEESLSASGEYDKDDVVIHRRDMEWLLAADAVVAEVSTPSLGVGYEIGRAVENRKPVLCLYRPGSPKKLSAMIAGSPELTVVSYSALQEAFNAIDDFLKHLPD
jgi:nucleoside 2-deoxyribosyltransferase